MRGAREQSEHTIRVGFIMGLPQNFVARGNHGVCGKDEGIIVKGAFARQLVIHRPSFTQGQRFHITARIAFGTAFVGICGDDAERKSEIVKNFPSAGRLRCKNQLHYI